MYRYILKRLLMLIPVILGVAFLVFTLLYLTPGDPAALLTNDGSQEVIEAKREELGLNDPYLVQLYNFFKDLFLKLDFGNSYVTGKSVTKELFSRLPTTLLIAVLNSVIQVIVGIPLGIVAATHRNKWQDSFCMFIALIGISLPEFWFALMMVLLFNLKLNWLPAFGLTSWTGYIMPVIALAMHGLGAIARNTRSQMLEVIRSDYITTVRAKGATERSILYKHALPNALIPVVTVVGGHFAHSMGGAVVIETVFSIRGVGAFLVEAISNRDYPVVRGSVVILSIIFSVIMLLVDLVYAYIDPRIKAQYEAQGKRRGIKKNA